VEERVLVHKAIQLVQRIGMEKIVKPRGMQVPMMAAGMLALGYVIPVEMAVRFT
jgi:hypothetical protein